MPTYEYRCPEGHTFDRFAKMSESAAELPCPTCGKVAVRQVSGGAGLVFKGSGFYLTDYGKNAHRTGADGKHGASGSKHESGESSSNESASGEAKSAEAKAADAKPPAAEASSSAAAASTSKSGADSAKSEPLSAGTKAPNKKPKQ
jgi:putative FmdB family regulatory protein